MYVDLHIHTTASDGTWDCDELMTEIRQAQISLFAITDHDTLENSYKMLNEIHTYHEYQGRFISGVEVSCTDQGKLFHLTSYGVDPTNAALLELLAANRQTQQVYNETILRTLCQRDARIDYAKYEAYQYNRKRGGWKGLNFLLDEGLVADVNTFIQLMRTVDIPIVFRDPVTVIMTIRNAGGYPFLAHPTISWKGQQMPADALKRWIDMGIAGVECYSSYCSVEDSQVYAEFCRKHDLWISTGSDCHGTFVPGRTLGAPYMTVDRLNLGFL